MSFICDSCGNEKNSMPTLVHEDRTYCILCAEEYKRSPIDWIIGTIIFLLTFYFSIGIPTSINLATYIFFVLGIYGFTLIILRLRRNAMLNRNNER